MWRLGRDLFRRPPPPSTIYIKLQNKSVYLTFNLSNIIILAYTIASALNWHMFHLSAKQVRLSQFFLTLKYGHILFAPRMWTIKSDDFSFFVTLLCNSLIFIYDFKCDDHRNEFGPREQLRQDARVNGMQVIWFPIYSGCSSGLV